MANSGHKDFLQRRQHSLESCRRQATQPANDSLAINRSNLIEYKVAGPSFQSTRDPKRIRMSAGGERRDDERAQMLVQLVGGNHYARPSLANFASAGRIQIDEKNLATPNFLVRYHSHSVSSNFVRVGGSVKRSSALVRARFAASLQPARGRCGDEMIIAPLLTTMSTSSQSLASSISGLGRRMPRELPIRTSLAFIKIP